MERYLCDTCLYANNCQFIAKHKEGATGCSAYINTYGVSVDRIGEICEAERNGRLVVLPCKVGDTVYVISKCENVHMCRDDDYFTGTGAIECPFEKDCEFEECDDGNTRVFETTIRGGWVEENHICVFCDTLNFEIVQSDIGKTVFLTREEAEGALQKEAQHE